MKLVASLRRQISAFLSVVLIVNGLASFAPAIAVAEDHAARASAEQAAPEQPTQQYADDVSVPPDVKGFTKYLWEYFLGTEPPNAGVETFVNDFNRNWDNPVYQYGFFIDGLRDLLQHPKFQQLSRKGREFRARYWMDLVKSYLEKKADLKGMNLDPFPELISAVDDFQNAKSNNGQQPIDYQTVSNRVRNETQNNILNYMSREDRILFYSDPTNRMNEQDEINARLFKEQKRGKEKLNFEKWKLQLLGRIDEIILQNYKNMLKILLQDYQIPMGLHDPSEQYDPWYRDYYKMPKEVPPHIYSVTAKDLNNLEFRVDYKTGDPRIYVSIKGSAKEYKISIRSPQRTFDKGEKWFFSYEYEEVYPSLPDGLTNLMQALKPVRNRHFDIDYLLVGLESDAAAYLYSARENIVKLQEEQILELGAKLKKTNQNFKSDYVNLTPDKAEGRSRALGGMGGREGFDTSEFDDFIWFGYTQTNGFQHWQERDRSSFANNSVALGQVDPREIMPVHVKYRSIGFLKWMWDGVVKFSKSVVRGPERIGKGYDPELMYSLLKKSAGESGADSWLRKLLKVKSFSVNQVTLKPMPRFFDLPRRKDFTEGVRVVNLPNQEGDLVVESQDALAVQSGCLMIVKSPHQDLVGVRVLNQYAKELKPGMDYEVIEQPRGNVYAIRLLRAGLGTHFKYAANFANRYYKDPPEALEPLSLQAMQAVLAHLRDKGHTILLNAVQIHYEQALRLKVDQMSIRNLEMLIQKNAMYAHGVAQAIVKPDGVTCYNCSGAADMSTELANIIYANTPGVIVENRTTYSHMKKGWLREGDLHGNTLVRFPNGHYFILDVTPGNTHPDHKVPSDILKEWSVDGSLITEEDKKKAGDGSLRDMPLGKVFAAMSGGAAAGWLGLYGLAKMPDTGVASAVGDFFSRVFFGIRSATDAVREVMPSPPSIPFLEMLKDIPITAYAAVIAAVPAGFLAKHIWTKWQIQKAKDAMAAKSAVGNVKKVVIKEDQPHPQEIESAMVIEVKERPLHPQIIAAMENIRKVSLEMLEQMPKDLDRKVEASDPILVTTQLGGTLIDFLSGKYSPIEACKLLEKRFFNLQCPTQDARAVLDAAIAATQSLKTQIAFQVELLKTGKEARRGLHYRDPILRRTVEITLDKIKNIAGSVDADKINLKLEPARNGTCQQQVVSGS